MSDPRGSAPQRRRISPVVWIVLAGVALAFCLPITCIALVTGFGPMLRTSPSALVDRSVPSPIVRSRGSGFDIVKVDWSLDHASPRRESTPFSVLCDVRNPDGTQARDGRVIVLWGRDFGASSLLDPVGSTPISVWPSSPGFPTAIAVTSGGGSVLECHSQGDDASWICTGRIDPSMRLELPSPPECPTPDWMPLFDAIAPGACFGLTSEQFSRIPAPLIHVQTKRYDDFRLWPARDRNAARFEIGLGETAESMTLEEDGPDAARLFRDASAALSKKFGEVRPALAGCDVSLEYGSAGNAGARLKGVLADCAASGGGVKKFELEAWSARRE